MERLVYLGSRDIRFQSQLRKVVDFYDARALPEPVQLELGLEEQHNCDTCPTCQDSRLLWNLLQPVLGLSSREFEIAKLVVDGANAREIARRLHISIQTIKAHKNSAFKKLGVATELELALKLYWEIEGRYAAKGPRPVEIKEAGAKRRRDNRFTAGGHLGLQGGRRRSA